MLGLAGYVLAAGLYTMPVYRGTEPLILMGETPQDFSFHKNLEKSYGAAFRDLLADFSRYSRRGPVVCLNRAEKNDLQRSQCEEFWLRLLLSGSLLGLPLLFMALGFTVANTTAQARMVRAFRLMMTEKNALVVQPVARGHEGRSREATRDWFEWFQGVKGLWVKAPDGREFKVYMAPDEPTPLVHDSLIVVEWGTYFGRPRHFATLHAPYMAVIGGRERRSRPRP